MAECANCRKTFQPRKKDPKAEACSPACAGYGPNPIEAAVNYGINARFGDQQ